VDVGAATWLVSVTESTEADGLLAMENGLFSCVDGAGVLDVEREEVVEGVREVVVEVGAELVELTELWLNVDETDEAYSGRLSVTV
jgi:hypothetical protein